MRTRLLLCALALGTPTVLAAEAPLAAIDWLKRGPGVNAALPLPDPRPSGATQTPHPDAPRSQRPLHDEPPVATSGETPNVQSAPLDAPNAEAAGLLSSALTGLPRTLWSGSDAAQLAALIARVDPAVPALSAQFLTLLLAEADAPEGSASLLVARIDRLMEEGAVDAALALVEQAGGDSGPEIFSRWLDLSLIAGDDEAACRALSQKPHLSQDLATRIYCDARTENWEHAVTVYGSAQALGQIGPRDAELLARFLDPELIDASEPLNPPARPTPLEFHLFEAIGEALPTQPLPRMFAAADLSGNSGWRAQILAAERLARRGTLSENRLLGIYTDREPAASGGVWDRVEAVQALEAALNAGRSDLIGPALLAAWPQMRSAGLLVPFSELYAPRLQGLDLDRRAAALAQRAALLSPDYEAAARRLPARTGLIRAVNAVAQGELPAETPLTPAAQAVTDAWRPDAAVPAELEALLREGKLGEAILRAIALFKSGAQGNHDDLTGALATLRRVGLEDTARRAAIQQMILSDEGAPL
ncbi:hypothetical protein [Alloyangia pacifica]|uniref:Antifreeze protein n=1 Tax=Alloyangia pacifica TaxID=311180 RepID=A0A1I6P5F1_9RHOB|nr:hypothetical protein [Alloyangia pacifica]SDG19592.1 hypothetical protein SAMN04488245_10224 [Alloyangia pacifica]SFS35407.1 hypothetical protein SAMN04488050_101325 [Alloyangia pacifica]